MFAKHHHSHFNNVVLHFFRALKSNVPEVQTSAEKIVKGLGKLSSVVTTRPDLLQVGGRDFAFSLAHIYVGSLLLEHAVEVGNHHDVTTVHQYTMRDLVPIATLAKQDGYGMSKSKISDFVFEGYEESL